MYSYADRIRAVELYIKLGKRVKATIRQLDCPRKNALRNWYREYEQHRELLVRCVARALPTFPLSQFEADVASLGDTEVERITRERIGQGYFRNALLDYWNNKCPFTGISERALLRA